MRLLQRLFGICFVMAGVLVLGAGLFWYFDYRSMLVAPPDAPVPTLSDRAYVHTGGGGALVVEASNFHDAIRSLGFAHALNHAWTMAIWRQAASGQLSEWLGGPALAADRLTRQLDLANLAQTSAHDLTVEDRRFVEAYTEGVNAAWPLAINKDEFLMLGVEPAAWEPWHVLSVERLLAWLSEPALTGCLPDLELCLGDQALRAILHLHGFEYSVAWQRSGGDRTILYQRHVTGAYARPVFQEVTLQISGWQPIRGASIVGTPFFPAAFSDSSAWAILLSSPRTLVAASDADLQFARITSAGTNEHLTTFSRAQGQLSVGRSGRALTWSGLLPNTDIGAWRALLLRQPASFALLRGDGIHADARQHITVSGQPRVQHSQERGVLIGNSEDANGVAAFIESRVDSVPQIEFWTRDLQSQWSATALAARLRTVEATPSVATALAYLENWDHEYQSYSIGATVFSEWMRSHAPDPSEALKMAVMRLTQRLGPDQSQWRWDRLHTEQRYFVLPQSLQVKHFAPLSWPGRGHSTTLVWGGESVGGDPVPPAAWEMWMDLTPAAPVYVRRRQFDFSVPLGRSIAEAADPIIFGLPTVTRRSTVLYP